MGVSQQSSGFIHANRCEADLPHHAFFTDIPSADSQAKSGPPQLGPEASVMPFGRTSWRRFSAGPKGRVLGLKVPFVGRLAKVFTDLILTGVAKVRNWGRVLPFKLRLGL